ncbi:MAG: glycosyltransferase [bacterium]|nr:glycosyltransferase [bacterium]
MQPISIIIPCLNEEFYIDKLLGALAKQTFRNFEVIVIDGKSEDKTVEVIERFRSHLPALRCEVSPKRNVIFQRNYGVTFAKHELLLFLDADTQMKPHFLEKTIAEIEKRHLDLATINFKPLSTRADDALLCVLGNIYMEIMQVIQAVGMGWCIFSHKKYHAKLNGFDLNAELSEDFDYTSRAVKLGAKIRVLHSDVIYISVRRLEKEGRFNFAKTALMLEVNRISQRKALKKLPTYEFGNFKEDGEALKFSGQEQLNAYAKLKRLFDSGDDDK